ncbi:uncharacterized protein LOC126990614 [Eriocheir sinensis]|uniref:uncharacterized protein LOC126990614 n=1 Tax=Eriocheir sinensis TaxID=95602 RepID=UPI0021C57DD3|nr:uncharacterized protein LOC126990614 [Eriocheir sinensis]
MPTVCIVQKCNAARLKGDKNIHFFSLPKEKDLRKKWIELCGTHNNRSSGYVCSRHFESNAFERNLKYELFCLPVPPSQIKFKKGAVPTLGLPTLTTCEPHPPQEEPEHHIQDALTAHTAGASSQLMTCETVIEVHPQPHPPQEELLLEHHIQDALTAHTAGPSSQPKTPPEEVGEVYPRPLLPQEEHHYQETCTSPEPKNKKMLQFIKRMSFYNKDLHKRLTKVTKERNYYREEIKKYQEIINKLRNELDNVRVECQENVSKALSKTFTKNQTKYFVSNKHILKWEEEDISKALTLRSLSPKAYRFLRKHWNFPLPSPATISKWVS